MKSFIIIIIICISSILDSKGQYVGGLSDGFAVGTLGGSGNEIKLPIELISFTAECEGKTIALKWTTASETNNNFYTVEKRTDKNSWVTVGKIDGAGSSSSKINYSYTDIAPVKTSTYYRLKQTDFDGESVTSNVILASNCQEDGNELNVYPNPSSGNFEVKSTNTISTICVIDGFGNVVYKKQDIDNLSVTFDISQLPKNRYLLGIYYPNKTLYKQIVIE